MKINLMHLKAILLVTVMTTETNFASLCSDYFYSPQNQILVFNQAPVEEIYFYHPNDWLNREFQQHSGNILKVLNNDTDIGGEWQASKQRVLALSDFISTDQNLIREVIRKTHSLKKRRQYFSPRGLIPDQFGVILRSVPSSIEHIGLKLVLNNGTSVTAFITSLERDSTSSIAIEKAFRELHNKFFFEYEDIVRVEFFHHHETNFALSMSDILTVRNVKDHFGNNGLDVSVHIFASVFDKDKKDIFVFHYGL